MKKTFSFLLALCLLLSLLPVGAYAADTGAVPAGGQGEISASGTLDIDESILPDSQEILDSYAQSMLYPQYTMSLFSLGPDRLGDARQQYIYNQLKDWISQVAVGEKPAYLKIEIPSTPELSWTYEELGISDPAAESLEDIFYDKAGINKIIDTLMVDMPYELYWFDKSQGNGASCYFSLNYDGSKVQLTGMEFIFSVIDSYKSTESYTVTWGENVYTYYKVNSTKFNSVQNAVVKAQSIVQTYAGKNDYEKLLAYKNEICALTDYDHNAANTAPTEYGDPWQIISVFDGDSNTKVVCEGYSKAFQYLCDLSSFQDSNTVCYTAMGYLSGGGLSNSEGHMWNIVSLGGKNYLVDVTNSDAGTKGENGQLFLVGASGSPKSEYTISLGNETLRYNYNLMSPEMKDMMGDALVLSDKSYDPNGATEPECTHEWVESGVNKAATCTEAGEMEYECSKCGQTKTETIEALDHYWGDWTSADENNHSRTCMRDGCGATETGEHSWDEGTVTTEPTATEAGVKTYTCTVCQATKTEAIAATGTTEPTHTHSWSSAWSHDDNYHWHECTADGCDIKDDSGKNGYAAHIWDEGKVTTEPTATEAGVRTFTCTVCQATKTEEIAATGTTEPTHTHSWSSDWKYDDNYHWHDCTADGCDIKENSGKNGYAAHTWDEGKVTKEPTATEAGVRTFTCTVCQATKTEEIAATGTTEPTHTHSWSSDWKYDDKYHWHDCTVEGCDIKESSGKDGYAAHTWDEGTVTKEPTATEAGVKTYTCTVCQATKTEEIPAIGTIEPTHTHNWSSDWKYDDNYHWHECTADGCDIKENSGKNGYAAHNWDEGKVTKEPSTTEKGIKTYTCKDCGAEKTEEIPMLEHQHSWSKDWTMNDQFHWHDCTAQGCTETDNSKKDGFGTHSWDSGKVLKEATTSAAGTMEYKCTVCGYVKTEQIPVVSTPQHQHQWSSAWTYNNTNHWHECTASGCTLSNAADKYGYAPHSFGAWRTVKEATAITEGLMEHQCQCGYKESKTIPVKTQTQCNHNWSGWTFNYPNYWERTCSICHSRDIRVTQVAQPKIISGANAVWRQGSSNGLSFTSDAPVSEFKSVTLNGFTLNSSYYTVTEGSTIVTLKKSCLDQLGVGTHRLGIVSSGGTAETTFTVKAKTILNNQTPTYNSSKPWTTPKTGDSANMGLWIGMIAVCAVGLGGVALYVVKFKKNKRN